MYEASGYSVEPEVDPIQSTHGEVVGSVDDMPDSKSRKKGLEVSFINGQIVLDRSTLVRPKSLITSRTVKWRVSI